MAETADDRRIDVFWMRLATRRAPGLNTMNSVLSSGLEIAQKVARNCQNVEGPNHYRGVILLLRKRVYSFGNLHCTRELGSREAIAPQTYKCRVLKARTTKRATQGLGALVTNSCFR